jgi:hypothetical protein
MAEEGNDKGGVNKPPKTARPAFKPKGQSVEERGTLTDKEPHPSAMDALDYIKSLGIEKLPMYLEAYSSCAIEGNRLGEICSETLHRIMNGKPVSDRYVLGLAWSLKNMEEMSKGRTRHKK